MLTDRDFQGVLDDLCVKLGFMLFEPACSQLSVPPYEEIDEFAETVMKVEGHPSPYDPQLLRQVVDLVRAAFARAAARPENMDLFVLDTLANDLEGFGDILRLINHDQVGWSDLLGRRFEVSDVLTTLLRLIRGGDAEVCVESREGSGLVPAGPGVVPDAPLEEQWFRMTNRGRMRHRSWVANAPS